MEKYVGPVVTLLLAGVPAAIWAKVFAGEERIKAGAVAWVVAALLLGPIVSPRVAAWWRHWTARTPVAKFLLEAERFGARDPIVDSWLRSPPTPSGPLAEGRNLVSIGALRLPDELVVRLSILNGRMLTGVTDEECVRLSSDKATLEEMERYLSGLSDTELTSLAEAVIYAAANELRGTPVREDDPRAVDAAVEALRRVDAKGYLAAVPAGVRPDASRADKCRMMRFVFGALPLVSAEHRAPLARLARR